MSARKNVTVRLPDGTATSDCVITFDYVLPNGYIQWEPVDDARRSGVVRWDHADPAIGTVEEWECHFSSCPLQAGVAGNQYAPQYDKPPARLHSMTVMGNSIFVM